MSDDLVAHILRREVSRGLGLRAQRAPSGHRLDGVAPGRLDARAEPEQQVLSLFQAAGKPVRGDQLFAVTHVPWSG
ncbi:MAG: hypothetical protein IRZ07_18080 [Microbispora sp.]|nr:hypothetical protein [Microbispora sp.]